jgi:hypothetical protein
VPMTLAKVPLSGPTTGKIVTKISQEKEQGETELCKLIVDKIVSMCDQKEIAHLIYVGDVNIAAGSEPHRDFLINNKFELELEEALKNQTKVHKFLYSSNSGIVTEANEAIKNSPQISRAATQLIMQPSPELRTRLTELKQRLEKEYTAIPFTLDPPHRTR